MKKTNIQDVHKAKLRAYRADWNKYAREVLKVKLDPEQQKIISAVQTEKMISVCSGTARGKDFTAAVAAMCFMYLTPRWDVNGELVKNTKVALTAPTGRQVGDIMYPEISRLFNRAKILHGRLVGYDIRTEFEEWFLTGFKADEHNKEAWTGFHAVNTMFVVTEASGIPDSIFDAIEGNLQGNSRLLLVFNPNTTTGFAARSQKSARFAKFRLDSLSSPNVIARESIIPGQVDYEWVKDKVEAWCSPISELEFNEGEGDFVFDGSIYRPNDLFRIKVRGMFPKVANDVLIPFEWVELANKRWEEWQKNNWKVLDPMRLGVDVAGMGRDNSVLCHRHGAYVPKLESHNSKGLAEHMAIAGMVANTLRQNRGSKAFIDTIGEGAGVYSRLQELNFANAYSCKFSESAEGLKDITGVYEFANMRAYLYWALRDWLNPANKTGAALPTIELLTEELTEIKYKFQSNGKIIVEPKEEIKARLKRSPDYSDSVANTFYPDHLKVQSGGMNINDLAGIF